MTIWFFVAKLPQSVVGRPQSQSRLAPDYPRTRGCYPRNVGRSCHKSFVAVLPQHVVVGLQLQRGIGLNCARSLSAKGLRTFAGRHVVCEFAPVVQRIRLSNPI
jgi:hypothetical protein